MSLASRTLRTAAAAAGMAALGVGLAGPALAAPAVPEPALLPDDAQGLPALPNGNVLATLPGMPGGPQLPMLFVFEGPTVHTPTVNTSAGPARAITPALGPRRAAAPVSTSPAATPAVRSTPPAQVGPSRVGPTRVAPTSPGADRVGALPALDSVGMFDGLTGGPVVNQGIEVSSIDWLG
jgi:hypothetical protein